MATNPKLWAEGDTVPASELTKYVTALQEVAAVTGEAGLRMATPYLATGATVHLLRTRRYLHFRSNGRLLDSAGLEPAMTLNEGDHGRGTLDLDTTWVGYGGYFIVNGVAAVWHDDAP